MTPHHHSLRRSSTGTARWVLVLLVLALAGLVTVSVDSHWVTSEARPFHPTPGGGLTGAVARTTYLQHRVVWGRERWRAPPRLKREPKPRLSFAVISDTHEYRICRIRQGRLLSKALRIIRRRRPAFVVGVGDLIAGGGDCRRRGRTGRRQSVDRQLVELRRVLLERLPVSFIPVAGNHDLTTRASSDPEHARRTWRSFWNQNIHHAVAAIRRADWGESYRFTVRGVGIAVLGYYGTDGVHADELAWVGQHVRPGDLVFRHVNPFGVSCLHEGHCGIAITDEGVKRYEQLVELLKERRVGALFSGHTHAFYEGTCNGLRFINTGALGSRSMEYLVGWAKSPYRKRQAFVWVDVFDNGRMRITFHVWDPEAARFVEFDPRQFPQVIRTRRLRRGGQNIGVAARCVSHRSR